jgi:hypothetical protein
MRTGTPEKISHLVSIESRGLSVRFKMKTNRSRTTDPPAPQRTALRFISSSSKTSILRLTFQKYAEYGVAVFVKAGAASCPKLRGPA